MTILINPHVAALEPYLPGEQPREAGYVKLNTNECPYPPSPHVAAAIRGAAELNKYPDPVSSQLRSAIAERYQLTPSNILVGNGSDEVLRLICHTFLHHGEIGMLDPTYVLYQTLAAMFGAHSRVFPSTAPDYHIPPAALQANVQVFFLPNPNPPIGTLYKLDQLTEMALSLPSRVLVIDEAYVDFAAADCLALLTHPNVLITRTFSKSYSLAGLRIGYVMGPANLISEMDKIRDSYNINRVSQVAALAAWNDHSYHRSMVDRIVTDRKYLQEELEKRGFSVPPSAGNFVFARKEGAKAIYLALKARKVLVRYFETPSLKDGIRITVGTRQELESLLATLDNI